MNISLEGKRSLVTGELRPWWLIMEQFQCEDN
jgi:hypothetical protein